MVYKDRAAAAAKSIRRAIPLVSAAIPSRPPQRLQTLRRALKYLRLYRWWFLAGIAAALLTVASQLAIGFGTRGIIDTLARRNGEGRLFAFAALLAGAAAGMVAFGALKAWLFAWIGERTLEDLRNAVQRHARAMPVDFFERERPGYIMALFTSDTVAMARLYHLCLPDAVSSALEFGGTLVLLAVVYGRLTLLASVPVLLYYVLPALFARKTRSAALEMQQQHAALSSYLHESIAGAREILAFNRSSWDLARAKDQFAAMVPPALRLTRLQLTSGHGSGLLYWTIVGSLYWLCGRMVLRGELTLGSLVAFVWYFNFLESPMRRLSAINGQVQTAMAAADRVFGFLDRPVAQASRAAGLPLRVTRGEVVFENVGFAYEPGKPVLRDISLRLEAGRTLAVVGPSGAGKTTIVNLLLGFHEPTEGRILIDGQDLRTVAAESLRDHIGVVFQDTFLFRASVLENIRFGNLGASNEQVVQAARAAHAHEFILELPRSYDTEVGERGATLSGGQRQRIAIARALLRDPRILILDEATSALDAASERVVSQAVAELMRGRTSLSISHRLASIAGCDSIVVLENGRIAAAGTHAELLTGSALYRRLYELQTTRNSAPNFA